MSALAGKVALISGTARGQGRAAALAFARAGASVVGCDILEDGARETVALVQAEGGEMISLQPLDPSEPSAAERWVSAAVDTFGGLDIVYNNAASLRALAPLPSTTMEAWDLTIRYELTIVFVTTKAAWPALVARGGGVVLSTGSTAAFQESLPFHSAAHGATKAGVLALTRMFAAEGAEHNIRAISISPGLIHSPATESLFTGERRDIGRGLLAKIPLGRAGECSEIADVAVFLASSAAGYINATDILVDGGRIGVSTATSAQEVSL